MTNTAIEARSVIVEREIPFPPEKIWRALTQPHLIEEWLMNNDFRPVVGQGFSLRADLGTHLRMEQSGFRPDQQQAYQGAKYGWQKFFANLEQVLQSQPEHRVMRVAAI